MPSQSSEPESKPKKVSAKATAKKGGETKKRKRVLEESDEEFEPGEVRDDDHEIVGADSDVDELDEDAMDLDEEVMEEKVPKKGRTAVKKAKRTSSAKMGTNEEEEAESKPYYDREDVLTRKKFDGKTIEEKLEAAQNELDREKMAQFSERVVVAVDRAFERMARYNTEVGAGAEGEEGDEGGDEEEERSVSAKKSGGNAAKKSGAKGGGGGGGGIKYTPLEQQYLETRKDFPDAVLFVETGYRYKFFGKDAEIAAKVLNIRAGMSHNFLSTSVPVHRLHVHAMRLVQAGYKVGVVSQTETAALKAISSNKSGPFKRAVSALYTKSTLVNENMDPLNGSGNAEHSVVPFLFALYESKASSSPSDIHIAIVAVNTSTGDIVYDEFDDAPLRNALETRLRHISPVEIILPANVSAPTKKLIDAMYATRGKEDLVRIEQREAHNFDSKLARQIINDEIAHFETNLKNFESQSSTMDMDMDGKEGSSKTAGEDSHLTSSAHTLSTPLQSAINLPKGTSGRQLLEKAKSFFGSLSESLKIVFGALGHYLKDFGLSSLICLTCNFNSFTSAKHMYLDGNALTNLELLTSSQNSKYGSLFGVLDQTSTLFGRRRLIQWIRQPLLRKVDIDERLDAVEEISQLGASEEEPAVYEDTNAKTHSSLSSLLQLLEQLPDLERGITRIFYNRCSVAEFLSVLVSFRHIEKRLPKGKDIDTCCRSSLLKKLLHQIPDLAPHVSYFLDPLNIESTDKQKQDLFMDDSHFPDLKEAKEGLKEVEELLNDHLKEIRHALGKPLLEYVKKNKDEYVIELTKAEGSRAPKSWIPLASPASASRFHTPYIIEKYAELCQWREKLAIETSNAWASFVAEFASRYPIFRDTVDALAQLDVLYSFSKIAKTEGFVRPTIVDSGDSKNNVSSGLNGSKGSKGSKGSNGSNGSIIEIKNGRHPIVEQLLVGSGKTFVPNDTRMGEVDLELAAALKRQKEMEGKASSEGSNEGLNEGLNEGSRGSKSGSSQSSPNTHKVTIITGPNMGGKTCYTRQVAILCVMAQMGCYVAAEEMRLTPLDLVATRMGAYDQMFTGQSTFFVELQETSDILRSATPRSLVILDELGRGTSTHDGFAIAYATLHHLLTHNRCFVLFVTHYPALSQLTRQFPNIVSNAHISYLEEETTKSSAGSSEKDYISRPRITFLHKLVGGVEDRSFGMNVARLANLPNGVIDDATRKSTALEAQVKQKYSRLALKKLYNIASKKDADPVALQELLHLIGTHS